MKRFLLCIALLLLAVAPASACGPGGFQSFSFRSRGFGGFGGGFGGRRVEVFSVSPGNGFGGFQQTEIRRGPFGGTRIRQFNF